MTGLRRAKLPQETKDKMSGHKREGAREDYLMEQIVIEERYRQAFEFLSVNGVTQSTEDVKAIRKRLEDQNKRLEAQNEAREREIAELKTA